MKKIFYFLLSALVMIFYSSCDKIENPYHPVVAAAECPEPEFPQSTANRRVLLEEFTGFRCPNCPGATAHANNVLKPAHGDDLILVSIHESSLAEPTGGNYSADYRTAAGYDYYYYPSWNLSTYVPIGMVNRVSHLGSVAVAKDDWSGAINVEKAKPLEVDLQMITEYNPSENKVCLFLQTECISSISGDFNVVVYVLEDSIVDWQINSSVSGDPAYLSPEDSTYVHRHMLLANVNGTWGTEVFTGSADPGEKFLTSFTYNLKPEWVPSHVTFVAYIYERNTMEIHQSVEHHLIE